MAAELLTGPPGSGKTFRVLEALDAALAAGRRALLIVPTASMAEHLLHDLARRLGAVPPGVVRPLAGFVEDLTPDCRELPLPAALALAERALAASNSFTGVAFYPGFQMKLLETAQELWAAGVEGRGLRFLLSDRHRDLGAFVAGYEDLLRGAGAVHRPGRLQIAAGRLTQQGWAEVLWDGFFHFTAAELGLVAATAAAALRCVVTLPDRGSQESRQALLDLGFRETILDTVRRPRPKPAVIRAQSPEREIEDVAGRIWRDRHATGRPFCEYGLILRNPETYAPIVAEVFERFGIPFRLQQPRPLADHTAIRYLAGLLRAAARGFDGAETLRVLKLAGAGFRGARELDRFEYALLEKLPARGLDFLIRQAARFAEVRGFLEGLRELEAWSGEQQAPSVWSERCAALASRYYALPVIEDRASQQTVLEFRSLAAALRNWGEANLQAAEILALRDVHDSSLFTYLSALDSVLRLTPLRISDRRRDVVQVLTVYEARQWELPVVFVCGLVERQFPRYHVQNVLLPDGVRSALAMKDIRLRTTADLDAEERFLFDLAVTRGTAQLYLTYPAQQEDGAETLRSFFLEPWKEHEIPAERFRVGSSAPETPPAAPVLRDSLLLAELPKRVEPYSPSSIEKYLQCPFQFFADRALRLEGRPPRPEERIDALLKGTIVHRTIARWSTRFSEPIGPIFEEVFEEECVRAGVRPNFRAEVLKAELLADLERFAEAERGRIAAGEFRAASPETEVAYIVDGGPGAPFHIRGRIDRYAVSDSGGAVVVDYKYSRPERIKDLCREHTEGARVQGPLYLLGLERQFGLTPGGMIFYGLRKEPCRRGWYAAGVVPEDPELTRLAPGELRSMLDGAAATVLTVVAEVRSGRIEVRPRDRRYCRELCPFRDVCRVNLL